MKKAVVTILLVLPFILMIIISFAAKIVSNYQYINVESICIAKDERNCYGGEILKIGLGDQFNLEIRIYPEFATNNRVNYISTNEDILTVSDKGIVEGIGYGRGAIKVESLENREIYSIINFEVKDDYVSSVELDQEELNLTIKQKYDLKTTVYPESALDKSVTYTSSNPSVASVDVNGSITALSAGETTITVTTVDGNKTDTCKVIVEDKIILGFKNNANELYVVDTEQVDLNNLIIYDPEIIDLEDIEYKVESGKKYVVSQTGSVLVLQEGYRIRVVARVKDAEYMADIWIKYQKN